MAPVESLPQSCRQRPPSSSRSAALGSKSASVRSLPWQVRQQVEQDLRWYRGALEDVADADLRIGDLLSPTTARLSYMGAIKGSPGNPTCNRALAVADINARVRRSRFCARCLGAWLPTLHRDDYALLALHYGIEHQESVSLEDAARGAGIPCGTEEELRWVQGHLDGLLRRAAKALRYRIPSGRPPAWETYIRLQAGDGLRG